MDHHNSPTRLYCDRQRIVISVGEVKAAIQLAVNGAILHQYAFRRPIDVGHRPEYFALANPHSTVEEITRTPRDRRDRTVEPHSQVADHVDKFIAVPQER
ncbi:MAG: hypothetical protein U0R19_27565 [Bryobacteraceae bacterium]